MAGTRWPRRPVVIDLGVILLFLAVALWLGHGLFPDPATRALALNPEDQILIEWFLAVDSQLLLGEQGLVTDRLNAPDGVNLLANASSPALGLLVAPITLTLGAPVSFAVLTIGNLAGTAVAWYFLFARTLGAGRAAAAVGGGFCGFAPPLVSQSNSHWHIAALWLVPAIVWSVVRLARAAEAGRPGRIGTSGGWLAGLVTVQYFLSAEILYLTALALALLTISYGLLHPDRARRLLPGFVAGLAIATGAALLLLAYPIWLQLAGPGSVPDGPFPLRYYSADLASWPAFSPLSLAGAGPEPAAAPSAALATGPAEYNTFLGWPLLVAAAAGVVWLRRHPLVLPVTITALVMALLSLGPELIVNRTRTGIPLPHTLLADLPVVEAALPQRYAIAVVPLLATLLVLALDRAREPAADRPASDRPAAGRPAAVQWLVPALAGLVLLPLLPIPLPATDREPVPAFVRDGHWRRCVAPGGVLVPVPLPTPQEPEPMRWAAAAGAEFGLPEGFFIGPYGPGGTASMGVASRPTSALLAAVASTGQVPTIGPAERATAAADLRHWRAGCVVLGPGQPHEAELRVALTALFGAGERVADAWTWRPAAAPS